MICPMTATDDAVFSTLPRPDFFFSDALAGVIASAVAANTAIDEN